MFLRRGVLWVLALALGLLVLASCVAAGESEPVQHNCLRFEKSLGAGGPLANYVVLRCVYPEAVCYLFQGGVSCVPRLSNSDPWAEQDWSPR